MFNARPISVLILSVFSALLIVGCVDLDLEQFNTTVDSLADTIEIDKEARHYSLIDKYRIAELSFDYIKPYPGYEYKNILVAQLLEQAGRTETTYRFRAWYKLYLEERDEWDDYTFDIEYNTLTDTYSIIEESISITRESLPDELKKEAFELANKNNKVHEFVSRNNVQYNRVTYRWYLDDSELTKIKDDWPTISGNLWIAVTLGHTGEPNSFPYIALVNIDQEKVLLNSFLETIIASSRNTRQRYGK